MPSKETMETIEKTLDVIEDQIETIERIPKVNLNGTTKKQQVIILGVTAIISFVAGGGLSYFVAKKKLSAEYEARLEEEIDNTKRHYAILRKEGEYADPTNAFEQYAGQIEQNEKEAEALLDNLSYRSEDDVQAEAPVETEADLARAEEAQRIQRNVFKDARSANSYFDYEEEMKTRSPDEPYVITEDEWEQNDGDFDQVEVTYFEEDDVLIDDRSDVIPDSDGTVGDHNLTRFGHGAKSRDIVHVRNERMRIDFLVVRSHKSYTEDVLGFRTDDSSTSLRHSDSRGAPRKFRLGLDE